MRLPLLALLAALACAAPAKAEDTANAAEIARASQTLAAIWRPITATSQAALAAACAGATDDLAALDAAMPQELNNRTLAAVHVAHGLVFVPTSENPADTFVFADSSLPWVASGIAVIKSADEDTGEVTLEDAAGTGVHLQLGHVAGQVLMRLNTPGGQSETFAGCAPTVEPTHPQGGGASARP